MSFKTSPEETCRYSDCSEKRPVKNRCETLARSKIITATESPSSINKL